MSDHKKTEQNTKDTKAMPMADKSGQAANKTTKDSTEKTKK